MAAWEDCGNFTCKNCASKNTYEYGFTDHPRKIRRRCLDCGFSKLWLDETLSDTWTEEIIIHCPCCSSGVLPMVRIAAEESVHGRCFICMEDYEITNEGDREKVLISVNTP